MTRYMTTRGVPVGNLGYKLYERVIAVLDCSWIAAGGYRGIMAASNPMGGSETKIQMTIKSANVSAARGR
jgi:hypothetical protein